MAEVQISHSSSAASQRDAERSPGSREIWRQLLGRPLLDRTRHRSGGATQAECALCHHDRHRVGSAPSRMGRQLSPSSSIIPNANCLRCNMPVVSEHQGACGRRRLSECRCGEPVEVGIALSAHDHRGPGYYAPGRVRISPPSFHRPRRWPRAAVAETRATARLRRHGAAAP